MAWQALPIEVIIQVLEALDAPSLVNCRRTSRLLKSLIDETAALQYRIALYASGMVDGPPGQLSSLERLNLLRSYEASWKNVDWSEHTSIPVPEGNLWELYGNVWAHSRGGNGINCVQLPSRLRGISTRHWTLEFDFTLRDFGMDPSQDLLVTIDSRHPEPGQIRLHTLSTGEKHPLSVNIATLEHTLILEGAHIWSYSIRVSGDYLGILFVYHDDQNELVVWNWKTGAKCLVVALAEMLSFTFLGHKFVLTSTLTSPYQQPALLLYSLDQGLAHDRDHADTHLLCFLFRSHSYDSVIHLTSDPSPEWSPSPRLQVPFQTAGDDQIIVLHELHNYNWRSFRDETFLIPASTLLEHVKATPVEGEGRDIEWESWGPRCCTEHAPNHGIWTVWSCFVFGMRYVFPRVKSLKGRPVMIVRDLCPRRYMRATEEEREESNALQREIGWDGPYSRSIVKCVPLPPGIRALSGVDFMISEDGIVVHESDPITEKTSVHLLTF